MIHRGRAEFDGQPHAITPCELVGMHPQAQPLCLGRLEDSPRLISVEGPALDEDIRPARMRCARVEHLPAHKIDVVIGAIGILCGHDMRAEEGRLLRHGPCRDERARLVMHGEAVPGLGLDCGRALAERLSSKARGIGGELLVGGSARGRHGGADTPGGVRRARHARIEFGRAVAREDRMHVGIDEPGQHRGTRHVM